MQWSYAVITQQPGADLYTGPLLLTKSTPRYGGQQIRKILCPGQSIGTLDTAKKKHSEFELILQKRTIHSENHLHQKDLPATSQKLRPDHDLGTPIITRVHLNQNSAQTGLPIIYPDTLPEENEQTFQDYLDVIDRPTRHGWVQGTCIKFYTLRVKKNQCANERLSTPHLCIFTYRRFTC